jgi:methyl-accepting chemotaxis protein
VEHIGLDHEDNWLTEITRITHRAMADLDQEKIRIQESQRSIATVGDQLLTVRSVIGGLKQIAKTLKIVAVNINIESSRLLESRELFKVMPQEIHSLSDTTLKIVRVLSEEIEAIAANLGAANQVMKHKLDHIHELVGNAQIIAEATTSDVTELINRSIQAFESVGSEAQVLSQSVGEIVQNIQIHDNISQRVEHVVEALADAGRNLTDSKERAKAVLLMDANLGLQHSQLKNILSDIDDNYQKSTQSFKMIGSTVENITMNIDGIVSVGSADRSVGQDMENSMGSLNDALKMIQESINQGLESIVEVKEIVQDATAVVTRISYHMKQMMDVNFDIHLKSLNAIIGSIRLGDEGKSIEVLVDEMKDLAHRSNKIVARADEINTAITNDVSVLCDRINSSDGEGTRIVEMDRVDLENGIKKIDAASTAFMKSADDIARSGGSLNEQVCNTTEKMRFLKTFADQLRRQSLVLDTLRTRLAPWIDTKSSIGMIDKERLSARYTMQKERDIQATVLAVADLEEDDRTLTPSGPAVCLEVAAFEPDRQVNTECELGDNVELF